MKKATVFFICGILATALVAGSALAITVDGVADLDYGPAIVTQATQTQFGDATTGLVDFAGGSELDQAYGVILGDTLYIVLAGNLESNFNKLDIFIDSLPGAGQNQLRGDNPNVDFDGLNRMGDDGTGNGLTFDAGFEPDYYITVTGGDVGGGVYKMFANYAELLSGGGGAGFYLGETVIGGNGILTGGTNPDNIRVTIDNSNVGGVSGGCDAASGAGVSTGIELCIPLSALGLSSSPGCVTASAFVNGGSHDFLSNQVLGPLQPSQCNLGEPRLVDFNQYAGDQFFEVCEGAVPVENTTWGRIKAQDSK
jgi:hypothetical protein